MFYSPRITIRGTSRPFVNRPRDERHPGAHDTGSLQPVSQDDLEGRVDALETTVEDIKRRLRATEQDAAAARVLAGVADRDVTDIKAEIRDFRNATTASFNALREDFVDLRNHVDRGFEQVDRGFAEMRGRLDATATGQQQIADLIRQVIDGQDR